MGKPENELQAYGDGRGWAARGPEDSYLPPYEMHAPPSGPPPAFAEKEGAPSSESAAGPSNAALGTRLSSDTVKFPKNLTVYYKLFTTHYFLGTSKNNLLFAVTPTQLRGPNCLRDGPDKTSPELASAMTLPGSKYATSVIQIFPRPGSELQEPLEFHMTGDYESSHRFHLEIGPKRSIEFFEWRNSRGEEVRELAPGRTSSGYKLVRLATANPEQGGRRGERPEGHASDGTEIMAVAAYGTKLTKGPYFSFRQSLGETFEIAAMITFLRVFEMDAAAAQGHGGI